MPQGRDALLTGAAHAEVTASVTTNEQVIWERMLGIKVTSTTNLATANDNIFDYTGPVAITLMFGEVTSVVATTSSMRITTSIGTTMNLCLSTDITTLADATMFMVSGDPAEGLNNVTTQALSRVAYTTDGTRTMFVLGNEGVTDAILAVNNATGTGTILWTAFYIPLGTSATMAASA